MSVLLDSYRDIYKKKLELYMNNLNFICKIKTHTQDKVR